MGSHGDNVQCDERSVWDQICAKRTMDSSSRVEGGGDVWMMVGVVVMVDECDGDTTDVCAPQTSCVDWFPFCAQTNMDTAMIINNRNSVAGQYTRRERGGKWSSQLHEKY